MDTRICVCEILKLKLKKEKERDLFRYQFASSARLGSAEWREGAKN